MRKKNKAGAQVLSGGNIHFDNTVISSGSLSIYGGFALGGTNPVIRCRGNIRIDENTSLVFGHHHQHIFQGLISGGGTLAVLKDAAVHLSRGKAPWPSTKAAPSAFCRSAKGPSSTYPTWTCGARVSAGTAISAWVRAKA